MSAGSPASSRRTRIAAVAFSGVAGIAVSVQTYLNGRLGVEIGSPELAAGLNTLIGVLVATVTALASGALVRGWRAARRRPVRVWWLACGCLGTTAMWANTAAAPATGVALVAVAAVFGKLSGALAVDAVGLSPYGRATITARRIAGAACAFGSVLLGLLSGPPGPLAPLLLLVAAVGAGVALQQAGNGHLTAVTGEPLAMGAVNFAAGAVVMAVALTIAGALPLERDVTFPAWGVFGGLLGVGIALVGGVAVRHIGVLPLMVAQITGQSVGALALDWLFPLNDRGLHVLTAVGVALAAGAVWVTYRPSTSPSVPIAR